MLRVLDLAFSSIGLILGLPFFLILYVVGWFDTGSPLFFQERIGRHQRPFTLVKFRTMRIETPSVATHLADASAITPLGRFLRRTKLDEIPQLWNVLRGDMSLVGPRPCLPNQTELISERASRQIFDVRPGITGLAQIRRIDMSNPVRLAETEAVMLTDMSIKRYFGYVIGTIFGGGKGDPLDSNSYRQP